MHRCVATTTGRRSVLGAALAVAALLAAPAQAQVARFFPQAALRGDIAFGVPPDLVLNGRPARLAPGTRIHGIDNMLLMSASLVGLRATVNYTVENTGLLMDVWLLRDDERAKLPWPQTPQDAAAWHFDPAAQAWSKP